MSGSLPNNTVVTLTGVGTLPAVKAVGVLQNNYRVVLTVNNAAGPYDLTMTIVDQDGNVVSQRDVTSDFAYGGGSAFDSTNNYEAASIQPLANGNFVVAFANGSAGGTQSNVFFQIYGPTGTPVGTTQLVDTPNGNLDRYDQLAQLANGDFVTAWYSAATTGTAAPVQEAAVFDSSGTQVVSPFTVSSPDDPAGSANTHYIAAAGNSFIEVSYPQGGSGYTYEIYAVANGAVTQTAYGQVAGLTSTSPVEHVAGLANGDFALVLKNASGNSDLTILDAAGNTVLAPEQVLTGSVNLNIYALATGGFVITHGGGSGSQLQGDIYDNAGNLLTSNVNLTSYTGTAATYTSASGQSNGLVTAARVTNGTPSVQVFGHTTDVPCYCAGTQILTDRGEMAVESLSIGDAVITLSGAVRPIRWIGRRSYAGRFAASNPDVLPILFRAGSLGNGLPRRDLRVSPLHAMFVDDVLVPARLLLDGDAVVQAAAAEDVDYIHIELDSHDVLLAEGAPAESFVDDNSRGMFHNAMEHRILHGGTAYAPARYCAPRVEDGEALEVIRRRLRERRGEVRKLGPLNGYLDAVDDGMVTGWARDRAAPDMSVRLQVMVNGVVLGEVVADALRTDLVKAGEGHGRYGFSFPIAGGLAPGLRHVVEVCRAEDGQALQCSPTVVEPAARVVATGSGSATPFQGVLDQCDRDRIAGWAWQPGVDTPLALQVLDNGVPLVRILANRDRPDLRAAGIGNGRHGFDIIVPGGLSPLSRHVLEIRRESDGAALPGTPVVLDPVNSFDPALENAVARAVAGLAGAEAAEERVLSFLVAQTEQLLQRRAASEGGAARRDALAQFRRRWGPGASAATDAPVGASVGASVGAPVDAGPQALVIDDRLPVRGRDAGSDAVLSHVRAMQSLGYAVSIVASRDMAATERGLEAAGVRCLGNPFYASVEDVLRRQAGCFDLVYLHRGTVAGSYGPLVRRYMPQARLVYSVADLHHLRLRRQAEVQARPELLRAGAGMRLTELKAAWEADAVITHSAEEAAMLRQALPGASVHVVPWAVPVSPPDRRRPGFAERSGVAFIGHGNHAPNADAAHWLVEAVMPLVWQADAAVECLLVGSELPPSVCMLERPGVTVLGHVPDLRTVFERVRLTAAPLRFGAGVKGKVLASLAAHTPCAMTPVAAEGLDLPPVLRALVGADAPALATIILQLHRDKRANRAASQAGARFVEDWCNEAAVEGALATAITGASREPPRAEPADRHHRLSRPAGITG